MYMQQHSIRPLPLYMPLQIKVSPLLADNDVVNTCKVGKCSKAWQERGTKTPQHEVNTDRTQVTVELRTPHL